MQDSVLFGIQVGVSLTGLALGVGMLACGKDPAIYLPVVMSIVGLWLPTPKPCAAEVPPVAAPQSSASSVGSPDNNAQRDPNGNSNHDTQSRLPEHVAPPSASQAAQVDGLLVALLEAPP